LNVYSDKVLFPEKLEQANKFLEKVGVPKEEEVADEANEICVLSFQKGNGKLEWPLFSLPSGYSCPFATRCKNFPARWDPEAPGVEGKTGAFRRFASTGKTISKTKKTEFLCYAARAQAQYPSANMNAFNNMDLLNDANRAGGVAVMTELILDSMKYYERTKKFKFDILRVHEAGDFFSSNYMKAWFEVAKRRPTTLFYAYTTSLPFWIENEGLRPKNFKMIASMDDENIETIKQNNLRYSRVVGSEEEAKQMGLPIDVDDRIAWDTDSNFALMIHGPQHKDTPMSKALQVNKKAGIYDKMKTEKGEQQDYKNFRRDLLNKRMNAPQYKQGELEFPEEVSESRLFKSEDDEIGRLILLTLKNRKPEIHYIDNWSWDHKHLIAFNIEGYKVNLKWGNADSIITFKGVELDLNNTLFKKIKWTAIKLYDEEVERQDAERKKKAFDDETRMALLRNSMSPDQLEQMSTDAFDDAFDLEESYYGLNTNPSLSLIKETKEFGSEDVLLKGHKGYRGKVFVHRNLNKPPYWTVKARRGEDAGLVIGYDKTIHLTNVIFSVGEKSRQRVLASGQKNVHAGVIGSIDSTNPDTKGWIPVTYNPYKNRTFVRVDNGEPIFRAKEAVLKNEKEVWVKL
jgi:hypothetical protein